MKCLLSVVIYAFYNYLKFLSFCALLHGLYTKLEAFVCLWEGLGDACGGGLGAAWILRGTFVWVICGKMGSIIKRDVSILIIKEDRRQTTPDNVYNVGDICAVQTIGGTP